MKLRLRQMLLFVLVFSITLLGQVPKNILMEYATNASCPPCAEFNPGNYDFLKSNYKNTVAVWYHAWWPGPNDPMYVANSDENAARINYYGINGVPDYVLNGDEQGWSTNDLTTDFMLDHAKFMNLESPVAMEVNSKIIGDSIKVTIQIKVFGEVTQSDLRLHTAITEQMIVYPSPPGSNGEADFPHVFRKFCAGASGELLPALNIGDSLKFVYTEKLDSTWSQDPEVLTIVAWVQANSTKEVIQSVSDLFFYHIVTDVSNIDQMEKNKNLMKEYSIENINEDSLSLRIKSEVIDNAENWSYSFQYEGTNVDSFDVIIAPSESVIFNLNIVTNLNSGHIDLDIIADNLDENSNFVSRIEYFGVITAGDILIVDDDGGENFETSYSRMFNQEGTEFTKISSHILSRVKDSLNLLSYKYVIWNLGNAMPTLENNDVTFLIDYINEGGNLFIAGQDLGYDIHEVSMLSSSKFFYSVFFDALYIENTDSSTSAESVPGNPLFDNLSFDLTSNYPLSPDAIQSKRGNSIPVFKYSDSDNYAMLIYVKNEAKIAYLSVGLEQISPEAIQDTIINAVMNWFDIPTDVENADISSLPVKFKLIQNYPNPFNPTTTIHYSIPSKETRHNSFVQLKVYDVLGRVVATLVNENKNPGNYEVVFNANGFTSGIYYYQLSSGDFIETKKMILIK